MNLKVVTILGFTISKPDVEGTLVKRINRFLGIGVINGVEALVHIHDPGRLTEILKPGVKFYAYSKSSGKAKFHLIAVDLGDELVLVNSAIHNNVAAWLIGNGLILRDYRILRREPRFGKGRFDLMLKSPNGGYAMVEVKGVTLEEGGVAKFPDAPTLRGARHMIELAKAVEEGYEAYVIFLVLRSNALVFTPNKVLDPKFSDALRYAIEHGVRALAYKLILTRDWVLIPMGQINIVL